MERVLKIPELLENILLHLPTRDLLVNASLVCKDWQDTITASPHLQRALSVKPLSGRPLYMIMRNTAWGWAEDEDDQRAYRVFKNSFCAVVAKTLNSDHPTPERLAAVERPEASWRQILPCITDLPRPSPKKSQEASGSLIYCGLTRRLYVGTSTRRRVAWFSAGRVWAGSLPHHVTEGAMDVSMHGAEPDSSTTDDDNAARNVFNVPELLEAILLLMPIKALLTKADRVCRQWHATIQASPKLQRALFFQPVGSKRLVSVTYNAREPSLAGAPARYCAAGWTRLEEHKDDSHKHKVIRNPFRPSLYGERSPSVSSQTAEASWRRMFVCQPPATTVRIYYGGHEQFDHDKGAICTVSNARGVKMADLVHVCSKHVAHQPIVIFGEDLWENVESAADVRHLVKRHGTSIWKEVN
ncbi:hypothetical protein LTR36_002227 [Oleoguttula mirabilis]|uniref:F-box domain-containing protein n=1 Tax=Oleoguttula mirabilis TaxID=1507867 RepID=A0AAV9JM46_9PEZI|nr:hypothetical protein LTR36_002227 [Oleoguttula mirabilis]